MHRSQILIAELGLKARRRTTGIVAAPSALAYNEEGFLIDDNNVKFLIILHQNSLIIDSFSSLMKRGT